MMTLIGKYKVVVVAVLWALSLVGSAAFTFKACVKAPVVIQSVQSRDSLRQVVIDSLARENILLAAETVELKDAYAREVALRNSLIKKLNAKNYEIQIQNPDSSYSQFIDYLNNWRPEEY